MVFRTLVVAVAVFTLFVGGGFAAFQVADTSQEESARTTTNVTGESIVVQYDIYQLTDKAESRYTLSFNNSSVAVFNESGAELTRGTDYEWNNTDGTIRFLNTTATTEGNNATIAYTVVENTETVQSIGGPLSVVVNALGNNGIYIAGFALIIFLLGAAGIFGKYFHSGREYGGGR